MAFNKITFDAPITYSIISTGTAYCIGLKMQRERPGPHFVQLDGRSTIMSNDTTETRRTEWRSLTCGDKVCINEVQSLKKDQEIPMSQAAPFWPHDRLRSEAVAIKGYRRGEAARRFHLAFISMARGTSSVGASCYVRFYDPMTLKDSVLPNKKGQSFDGGDLILAEYGVRPVGTLRHASKNYYVPADMLYPTDAFMPMQEELYEVISGSKLSPEVLKRYEQVYNREDDRDEVQRARAIEEILLAGAAALQSLVTEQQRLLTEIIHPHIEKEEDDEVILRAVYRSTKGDEETRGNDLARAARIFRFNQHVSVIPMGNKGDYNNRYTLVPIRSSKVLPDKSITFTFAVPKHLPEDLWDENWDHLTQMAWHFRVSRQQVLQRPFHKKLREGGIRKLLQRPECRQAQQVIKALFGDAEALSKVEFTEAETYQPSGTGSLTEEQSRAVALSLRDDVPLSVMQAPAGSGKTTTISSMVLEQTKRPSRCTVVSSAMNIAIDSLASSLAKQTEYDHRNIIVFQAAMYLSKRSADDPYHDYRLPTLLVRLAEGEFGELDEQEAALVKSAVLIATRRFRGLKGMDWGSVLHGEVKMEDREDFVNAVDLLLQRYKPQIVLGTTSALQAWSEYLQPFATDIIIDEAGTVAVLDATCFLMVWDRTLSLTMVGDVKQLPNFSAPLDDKYRKWGFESALSKAFEHPSVACTILTKVFRSHPLLVRILSLFAYSDDGSPLQTDIRAEDRPLMKHAALTTRCDWPILVVNCDGDHALNAAKSFGNVEQTQLALCIAKKLAANLSASDVRFLALYSGARDEMNESFYNSDLSYQASAIDAAQGQECDITVLETAVKLTTSMGTRFSDMRERLTVAISRARHGLVIIGSVNDLKTNGKQWRRLLEIIEHVCPGSTITADELLRDAGTPVSNMALALRSFGLRAEDHEDEELEANPSGNWLMPPPPAPMLPAMEVTNPLVRSASDAAIQPSDEPVAKRLPPQLEHTLTDTTMEVDADEEPLVWAQPDPEEAAAAHAFLSQPGATEPSDDEAEEPAFDREAIIDGSHTDEEEADHEVDLVLAAHAARIAAENTEDADSAANDKQLPSVEESVIVSCIKENPPPVLFSTLTDEQFVEKLSQMVDEAEKNDEAAATNPDKPSSSNRPKLKLNVQKKPQPKPRTQKSSTRPATKEPAKPVLKVLCMKDVFGSDSETEESPKQNTPKKTSQPRRAAQRLKSEPPEQTPQTSKQGSAPYRKPKKPLFTNS